MINPVIDGKVEAWFEVDASKEELYLQWCRSENEKINFGMSIIKFAFVINLMPQTVLAKMFAENATKVVGTILCKTVTVYSKIWAVINWGSPSVEASHHFFNIWDIIFQKIIIEQCYSELHYQHLQIPFLFYTHCQFKTLHA